MDAIRIRRAKTFEDLHQVYRLTHDSYVAAGLCESQSNQMIIHHPDQDVIPETVVFLVEVNDELVGTVTYTHDNQFGLMVDSGFKQQIDRYRNFYGNVANVWRLAIAPAYHDDTRIVKHLFGIAITCVLQNKIPVCFFTLSPAHARIYQKLINAEVVCQGFDSNELIDPKHAEVVLLKLYIDKIPERWIKIGTRAVVI